MLGDTDILSMKDESMDTPRTKLLILKLLYALLATC